MKVLLISPLPPPNGGIASWTIQYLEYAKAMPLDVHLINNKIQDPRTRRGMAHWNIEKVKSEYTVEKVMQSLVGIYNKTIHHGERQEGFANLAGKEKLE